MLIISSIFSWLRCTERFSRLKGMLTSLSRLEMVGEEQEKVEEEEEEEEEEEGGGGGGGMAITN